VHDLRQLLTLLFQKFPRIGGVPGRPLETPLQVTADKGYDCQTTRALLAGVGIETQIPRRGQHDSNHLGHTRWPIERTLSWLKQFRRLRIRWDRMDEIHEAFLQIGCLLITWRYLIA
jgi:transposase